MDKLNGIIAAILILIFAALTLQASMAKDVPAELSNETVKIQDVVGNVSAYNGSDVLIGGQIETECPMGCWFILDDGTENVTVDLMPHDFIIPQKKGSEAKVYGEVVNKNDTIYIYGEIVEIGEEIFKGKR